MDRETLHRRLREASLWAREFGQRYVDEALPEALAFHIKPNASYDAPPFSDDVRLFPEDSRTDRSLLVTSDEERLLQFLWRDGTVPQWVNVAVNGATAEVTVLEILCCGRFTPDDSRLYHAREGWPPFHVLGPALPPAWATGERFSVHRNAECWTGDELAAVALQRQKVRSLALAGANLDDEDIAGLPSCEAMESLELASVRLDGSGLASLDRHPRLRTLRIALNRTRLFSARSIAALGALRELSVSGLATKDWGFDVLAERLPTLVSLRLEANDRLRAEGPCPPSLAEIAITARGVDAWPRLRQRMQSVSVHLKELEPGGLARIVDGVDAVERLDLADTRADEGEVLSLVERLRPSSLNIERTGIDKTGVARIRSAYPTMRVYPMLVRR